MTLQLAEDSPYLRVPSPRGGFDMVHVATFANLDDTAFENFLKQVEPYQLAEIDELSELSIGSEWKKKARQQRKDAKQAARLLRKQTKTDASAALKFAKAKGIETGTVKTGKEIVGEVAGKYVDMLGNVIPAIAPVVAGALVPGAGAAGAIGGLNLPGRPGQTAGAIPPVEEEETFLQRYGLWLGIGAVVILGGFFLTRK